MRASALAPSVPVVRTVADLRATIARWRARGESVAQVQTMGALHEGHLSLVDCGHELCDRVLATVYVNPLQFGPAEDFDAYPREEDSDRAKLASRDVDAIFMPTDAEMFGPDGGFETVVSVGSLGRILCGASRPGHFDGVATEVAKMLLIALPDVALFGEKDVQQLRVIQRLVRDLNIPVEIVGVPTVREDDGLALSSRNQYLDAAERRVAPALHRELRRIAGAPDPAAELGPARERLLADGFRAIDYLELVDGETLLPVDAVRAPARAMGAAWLGAARLIDNVEVQPA